MRQNRMLKKKQKQPFFTVFKNPTTINIYNEKKKMIAQISTIIVIINGCYIKSSPHINNFDNIPPKILFQKSFQLKDTITSQTYFVETNYIKDPLPDDNLRLHVNIKYADGRVFNFYHIM